MNQILTCPIAKKQRVKNPKKDQDFVVNDDISSESSEYEESTDDNEEESDSNQSDDDSYSDTEKSSQSASSGEQSQSSPSSEEEPEHSSDSDFIPGKRKSVKKPTSKRNKSKSKKAANTKRTRGRKRKRSDSEQSEQDEVSQEEEEGVDSDGYSGSDEEYRPNVTTQQRKKRKTVSKHVQNGGNIRRSTRNLGRETVKYDDVALYGAAIADLDDSDENEKNAKKKAYKTVAKKRNRGAIKRLTPKKRKESMQMAEDRNSSTNSTPNSARKRKIKLTHKAWQKKNKSKKSKIESEEGSQSQSQSMSASQGSNVENQALYTYTSWLDDIVSDTEIKYVSRGRYFPGKVNEVEYTFEVQTSVGLETFIPEEGKMKPAENVNEENTNNKDNADDDDNKMDVDEGGDDNDNDDEKREWFHKLKIGDYVQILEEENNEWQNCKISFVNRLFKMQYLMRKSLNKEEIYEYDPKTGEPNPKLREKMRPSVPIEDTPEPISSTVSPIKSKKTTKNSRFGDSDESEEEEEEESDEESEEYEEDEDVSPSRTASVSPIDDLVTKIESILYKMKIPRSTKSWKDTFNHLMPKTEPTPSAIDTTTTTTNSKQEMDIDEEEENPTESTPTIDEKQNDRDTEMDDKENSGDNTNAKSTSKQEMMVESDDENTSNTNNKTEAIDRDSQLINKYLCKYWNRSYHHCEWLSLKELRYLEAETKVMNFDKKFDEYGRKAKKIRNAIDQKKFSAVHFFNDLYLEIDRIISYAEPGEKFDTISGYTSSNKQFQININTSDETMYLVKWKGMQYDEATWEMESFLKAPEFESKYHGSKEIELLIQRQKIPPSKYLHPAPNKLNANFFKNKPSRKERVADGQVFKNGHKLRGKYQRDGVNWLINNWQYKTSCILADEMGLGKTVQTVTFINMLFTRYHQRGPFLVVAPLSTLGHWQREFRAWSDMNVIVYHGSASSRDRIVAEEFEWLWTDSSHSRARTAKDLRRLNSNNFKFNVMITTPQIINQDHKQLNAAKISWNAIIVDEAHSLKSRNSLFYRTLMTFKNRYTHTVLLTGTPIQNNMEELWCLLHFMDPDKFNDQESFLKQFENLAESKDELKKLLEVRLLQRMKYLVEKSLCQREEKIIWVELTLFQKKWYKALYQRSYDKLKACGAAKASLMNVAMQLRKCCNHPFLMRDVEKTMSPPGTDEITMNENLIKSSGKLVLLDKLLPKLKSEGHRVLIFSQMSHLLDILEDYLNYRQHLYERLDGSVTGIERQEAIDRFQKDDSIFCFLLTTRAGGVGINLMAADTVIIYDSDWNPMNDVQAIARCHRIGQTKQVNVYRLITRNCYEESMFKRADQKLALNKVVMGDMKDVGKAQIHNMLKKGAISMFLQDAQTDDDIKKFADANIDDILAQRTETVKHDEELAKDPDAAMFSEAVFVAHADDANINVDDENFWEALGVGKDEEEEEVYTSPFMRRRTRLAARMANMSRSGSLGGFDSDDEFRYHDNEEDEDEGTSLLGALNYLIYGQWQSIFDDLTYDEKAHLKLIDNEQHEKDEEQQDNDIDNNDDGNHNKKQVKNVCDMKTEEEYVPDKKEKEDKKETDNKLKSWQIEILKQASVETICKMANLMKPTIRYQKLGENLKRLETLMYDKQFRMDCIETLAKQIYDFDVIQGAKWKEAIGVVWKQKDEKNRFVDVKQMENRPNLCKMGCKKVLNDQINPKTGRKFDTCCANCANSPDGQSIDKVVHESYCERRTFNDWRYQIRDEALKTYLKKHPLQKVTATTATDSDNKQEADHDDMNHNKRREERYAIALPEKKEMISNIKDELRYHDTIKLMLAMRTPLINSKSLRDDLKNKVHGDIVQILLKLERMFKFKILCGLNKGDLKKLDFSTKKKTKAMPEWWSPKWDLCIVEGTLKYGWGNVPAQFAREQYEFTPTYKGIKKEKKLTKKQQLEQQQKNVTDLTTGIENVKLNEKEKKAEPIMIVKKRQWIPEGKKQETIIISICSHFRKEIREKYKKLTSKIKTANKLREQQTYNPTMNNISSSLVNEMDDMMKSKKKSKKSKDKTKKNKKNKDKLDSSSNKNNAFDVSQFDKINSITNYFQTGGDIPSGSKNAFEILGKKPKSPHKKDKKKKSSKYEKTKLTISFDENGNFKVPIKIGKNKMITSLGEICEEKGYHATAYIYPVGYTCCIAQLPSFKRPGATTTFTTKIVRGEIGPLFQITCSDDPDFKLSAKNPSKVWGELKQMWIELEEEQTLKKKQSLQPTIDGSATADDKKDTLEDTAESNRSTPTKSKKGGSGHGVSGPQKIGLAHADIKRVVECMPNALKCVNYKFKYRTDKDASLSSKKAFKKTLKVKKDKSSHKKDKNNADGTPTTKKKKRSKSPKKHKKSKDKSKSPKKNRNKNHNPSMMTTINNINNVNNINIINNIGNVNFVDQNGSVHTITSTMNQMNPIQSNMNIANNTMNDPIVIEDSPANVGNIMPSLIRNANAHLIATTTTANANNMNSTTNPSRNASEVIDLCDDSENEDDDINEKKQSRKRKLPSNDEMMINDGNNQPTKKRRVDKNTQQKLSAIWGTPQQQQLQQQQHP